MEFYPCDVCCIDENRMKISVANSKPYEILERYREYHEAVTQETNRSSIEHKKEILNYHLIGTKK